MSFLNRLKKEVLEFYQKIEVKILESDSFNILKERYQSLSLVKQQMIKVFLVTLFFITLFSLPFVYFSSSTRAWFEIKEKNRLSKELLKAREKASLFVMKETELSLKNKIQSLARKYSLENADVIRKTKKSLQASVEQIVFQVQAPYLNIRQATRLGAELDSLPQIRLDELSFEKNEDYKNHYDMTYKLSAFIIKKDRKSNIKKGVRSRNKSNDRSKTQSNDRLKTQPKKEVKKRNPKKTKPQNEVKKRNREEIKKENTKERYIKKERDIKKPLKKSPSESVIIKQ